jgi:HemY protein
MRIFLRLLVLLAAAIGLAVMARFNAGNVVLFYPPYRIDLSLNLFLVLLVLLFLVCYGVLNTIRLTQQMPLRVAEYRRTRREREANRALRDALKTLFEGRFGQAERAASRAAELPENAGLAALIGARAAHQMSQFDRRDNWLANAQQEPGLRIARLMTGIELLVDQNRPDAALEVVEELNATGARHIQALRLSLKANQRSKNWPEVLRILRLLDKNDALHPALSRRLRELAYDALLSDSASDADALRRTWSRVPPNDRVVPRVAVRAAEAFNARGLHDEAAAIVEKALAIEWDERLVCVYRQAAGPEGSPTLLNQIERCEQWGRQHPGDAELQLTLGSLCLKQKLWGRAQRCLDDALINAPNPQILQEAHLKLAQLHEALNHPEQAAEHYRLCAMATML